MTPIEVVQALLSRLELKLTCIGRDTAPDGRRGGVRVYQYQPLEIERDAIFAEWQRRDAIAQSSQAEEEKFSSPDQVPRLGIDPPPDIRYICFN